jgi:hypothetical protein
MSKITILYDIEKDLQNYDNNYFHQRYPDYGRKDLDTAPWLWPSIKKRLNDTPEDEKLEIIRGYLEKRFQDKLVMKIAIKSLNEYWCTIERNYFDRLRRYMGIKKPIKNMKVFLTTLNICPYNKKENYFYTSFFASIALQTKTMMHESMHLVFLDNFEKYLVENGVNRQGVLEINEALTVLLNWEFKEFLLVPENNNKPSAKDLQEEVVAFYKQKKPFGEILDRLIELRKQIY